MSDRDRTRERARAQAADSDAAVSTDVETGESQTQPDSRRATQPADRSQRAGGEPQTQGNILAETLARDVQEQTGADVGRGDVRVERDDGRVAAELNQSARERVATQQAAREFSDAVPGRVEPADVQLGSDGAPQLAEDARKRAMAKAGAADLDERLDIDVEREDVAVLDRGDGAATVLRPERQRDVTQRRVAEQTGLSPRTDFTVKAPDSPNAQAEVELTVSGRAELLRERLQEQDQITVGDTTIAADPDDVVVADGQVRIRQDGGGGGSGIVDSVTDTLGGVATGTADTIADLNRNIKGGKAANQAAQNVGGSVVGAADTATKPIFSGAGRAADATTDVAGDIPGGPAAGELTSDVLEGVATRSAAAGETFNERIATPAASALNDPRLQGRDDDSDASAAGEKLTRGAFKLGGAAISAPASAKGLGEATVGGAKTTGRLLEDEGLGSGGAAATAAGSTVATDTARKIERSARQRPLETAGGLLAGSAAGAALSPVRLSKLDLPDRAGGSRTVRGVRLTEPKLFEGSTRLSTQGRTLGGTEGARPFVGSPDVDPADVDFDRLGGKGATGEAVGRFETDVFRSVAQGAGAGDRFGAAESLAERGTRVDTGLELDRVEDIAREAQDVPEGAAGPIADAVRDLDDPAIFGSAATRAQLPDSAREPRDLDLEVRDPARAEQRLGQALEGFDAEPGDVFDLKRRSERPQPGEPVKMGRLARSRLETEGGVEVTRAGEELTKKAGASAFLRGDTSPAPGELGASGRVDVGPEPVAQGSFVRAKDPGDAATIGGATVDDDSLFSLGGGARDDVAEFQTAFSAEIDRSRADPPDVEPSDGFGAALPDPEVGRLLADETGTFGRRGDGGDADGSLFAGDVETDTDSSPLRGDSDGGGRSPTTSTRSPNSSGGRADPFDPPAPLPASGGAFGGDRDDGLFASAASGGSRSADADRLFSGAPAGGGETRASGGPFSGDRDGVLSAGGGSPGDSRADGPLASGGGPGGDSPASGPVGGGTQPGASSPLSTSPLPSSSPPAGTQPGRLDFDSEDGERGDRLLEEDGAEQGFVNPVKTAGEVLSADSNPRGGGSSLGLDGTDIDDMEGRL